MTNRLEDPSHPLQNIYFFIMRDLKHSKIHPQIVEKIADELRSSMESDKSDAEVKEILARLGTDVMIESELLRTP